MDVKEHFWFWVKARILVGSANHDLKAMVNE